MGPGCPVTCVAVEKRVACLVQGGKLHATAGELISKLVKPLGLQVPSYSLLESLGQGLALMLSGVLSWSISAKIF